MTLTQDQYFQIAQGYAKAAEDPFVPLENRAAFADKAEWFGFLGRRVVTSNRCAATAHNDYNSSFFASKPPRLTKWPLGMTLWPTGAALCLIGVLLFTNALNLFGEVASELTTSPMPPPKVTRVQPVRTGIERQVVPKVMTSPETHEELSTPSLHPAPTMQQAAARPTELLKVTANARIREGPSTTAKKIGTALHGTTLEVKAREGDWVQFVDPVSGSTGWIHSSLAKLSSGSGTPTSLGAPPADAMAFEPPKPRSNKRIKQKPSASIEASTHRLSRPGSPAAGRRAYADLPDDEAFLPPRKPGPGFLTKRRMLRKGVASPDFIPPRP